MTKEELEKEATEWVIKNSGYSKNEFHGRKAIETYLASAEPREKRIADLEDKLANADYQLEGRDLEIKELKAQLEQEKNLSQCMSDHNEQLRGLIKKMKQDLDTAIEEANRQEQWELYSVLNGIYNDNFEVITSVSN